MILLRMVVAAATLSLSSSSGIYAQQKVGGELPPSLLISPSVRAIGMGQTAVTSLDSRSFYFNPGTLALLDVQRGAISFNPASTKLFEFGDFSTRIHSEAVALRLYDGKVSGGSFSLALGYMHTILAAGPIQEFTFIGPGRVFNATQRAHNFTVAGGYKGSIDFGIGATVRYIKESILDVTVDGFGFDIGSFVKLPLAGSLDRNGSGEGATILAVRGGASVTNMGHVVSFGNSSVPLPTRGHFGLGLDFSSGFFSFSPTAEYTVADNRGRDDLRFGAEAGLYNMVFARVGRLDESENGSSETSYGFGFATRGLRRLLSEPNVDGSGGGQSWLSFLARNINLTFSFARQDLNRLGFSEVNFYQLEITL